MEDLYGGWIDEEQRHCNDGESFPDEFWTQRRRTALGIHAFSCDQLARRVYFRLTASQKHQHVVATMFTRQALAGRLHVNMASTTYRHVVIDAIVFLNIHH